MPMIQITLTHNMVEASQVKPLLKAFAEELAKTMDWPVERLTIRCMYTPDFQMYHAVEIRPMIEILLLEGKETSMLRQLMSDAAEILSQQLKIEKQQINVLMTELKPGAIMANGVFVS